MKSKILKIGTIGVEAFKIFKSEKRVNLNIRFKNKRFRYFLTLINLDVSVLKDIKHCIFWVMGG